MGTAPWKTTVHSHGVEVDGELRSFVERQMRQALGGMKSRIGHVHVRLYGEAGAPGLHTCYIRVDMLPSGGVARGGTAGDLGGAVAGAVAHIGAAVGREVARRHWASSSTASRARGSSMFGLDPDQADVEVQSSARAGATLPELPLVTAPVSESR